MVFGPIAVTYNLPGVDALALDGPTAAKIFNGAITTWNDPAIAALNPGVRCPRPDPRGLPQRRVRAPPTTSRSTSTSASNGAWGKGAGKIFNGGVGEGAKGNEGTSAAIKSTPGSITYNEWSFAKAQNLQMAKHRDLGRAGRGRHQPDSVGKTIAGAKVKGQGNDLVLDTSSFYKPTEAGAYPIVLATYEIVCSKYPDADTGTAVKAFLQSTIGGPDRAGRHRLHPDARTS